MAVVIRLQGLPVVAGSADIRHFFSGLKIPNGGVHIIGGKLAEAFIIFSTDEDARRAMSRTGGLIKNSHIQLFLSSKAEMQNTLEMNRKAGKDLKLDSKHLGPTPDGDISKLLTAVKKGIAPNKSDKSNAEFDYDGSGTRHGETNVSRPKFHGKNEIEDSKYVYLFGLPYSAEVSDIQQFFQGLNVVDIIFTKRPNGLKNGNGFVKFGSTRDANAALERNNEYMGHRFISIKKASEQEWIEAGGHGENLYGPAHRNREHSPKLGSNSSHSKNISRSKSPKQQRARSRSPHNQQYYIHLKNLSFSVEKRDIKNFIGEPEMPDSQIKFLIDKYNNRTREGFVMLKSEKQYQKCLGLHKSNLNGRSVFIFPIPRKAMLELIESYESQSPPNRNGSQEKAFPKRNDRSNLRCIYVRNFPFDVTKNEVQKFFVGFHVKEEDIFLLYDGKGVGLGEALVKFPSEHQALLAEGLNRRRFLGTEVLLRCISEEQMRELGAVSDDIMDMGSKRSPSHRDDYLDPINPIPEHSFGLPEDLVRGSYEPPRPPFGLPEDFGRRSGDFRRSPERLRNPYNMDLGVRDEPYGKHEMGNRTIIDYDNGRPSHRQNLGGRSKGTLIRMKNLPFNVTAEEILDFFYGYNVIPDSVDIKYTKTGMATGTATVCIENYTEAMAAVNELSDRPVGSRKVILNLVKN
ncbi:RNA-binding protein 12B isoform 1-T2 [Rhinophrynus dorsalis]